MLYYRCYMAIPVETKRLSLVEGNHPYPESFDQWSVRTAHSLIGFKEQLYEEAVQSPHGYQRIVNELLHGLRTFSTPEDQAVRLHLLLNLDLGESIHPLAEPFLAYLEGLQTHGQFEEIVYQQDRDASYTLEDHIVLEMQIGVNRTEYLTGKEHNYFSVHPEFVAAARVHFRRFIDRAIHVDQQAHSYQFNAPEQGREIARLLVHSPFFYRKMIKLNIFFYASGSAEFPLPLLSTPLLARVLETFTNGGDEALEKLWQQKEFLRELSAGINSQTTGVGRFRQQSERVINMIRANGWNRVSLKVFGSGLLQTSDMLRVLHESGIDCNAVGYDRLPIDMLLDRSRVFEYPEGEGAPGRLMTKDEVQAYIAQSMDKDAIQRVYINNDDMLRWYDGPNLDLRDLPSWMVFVATNSIVPHLDPREQLLAIRTMMTARSAILYLEGMYYPIRKSIFGVHGTMQRTKEGVVFNPKTLGVTDTWDTQTGMITDVDANGPLPLAHPTEAQKRPFYYPERISMEMNPYLQKPGS